MTSQAITSTATAASAHLRAIPDRHLRTAGLFFAAVFVLVSMEAAFSSQAFDRWVLHTVQRIDAPYLSDVLYQFHVLTAHNGAITMWLLTGAVFLGLRWWAPLLLVLTMPILGGINEMVGAVVIQSRPTPDEFVRATGNVNAPSYPSGHVIGAVLLYGVIFLAAGKLRWPAARFGVRAVCAVVIVATGFSRVWYGAHWPSDVTGAYALGGLFLALLIALYQRVEVAVAGLPFVHAAAQPHDESVAHAHALTSLVLFEGPTVEKVYAPGLLPRLVYWLSFQAPFPYLGNVAALRAALYRRNLAAMLTEHWYGARRVARIVSIERVNGRPAIRGEFITGGPPRDRAAAKDFLRDLRAHFEEVGFPTWQIDPRQPRAIDNIIEAENGRYMLIDLESGLVSPLVSLKTWKRALRRGLVPIFDDVYFDLTRAYLEREAPALVAAHGDDWLRELHYLLDRAEEETARWHAQEPRIWSRLVRGFWRGFGLRALPRRIQTERERGADRARAWVNGAIELWQREGRLSAEEAGHLRRELATDEFEELLPHLGVHLGITVALRFPFGSLTRATWTTAALFKAATRRLTGRMDRATWRRQRALHSPLVIALTLLPSVGVFAYLATPPVWHNAVLLRIVADAAGRHLPARLYHRLGVQRIVARPAR